MLEMAIAEGCIIQKRPLEYSDEITKTFNEVVISAISPVHELDYKDKWNVVKTNSQINEIKVVEVL